MAKKTKRQVRVDINRVSPSTTAGGLPVTSDFNPDYGYVLKDLRRIGILAGSFIVILVAISFFLR